MGPEAISELLCALLDSHTVVLTVAPSSGVAAVTPLLQSPVPVHCHCPDLPLA